MKSYTTRGRLRVGFLLGIVAVVVLLLQLFLVGFRLSAPSFANSPRSQLLREMSETGQERPRMAEKSSPWLEMVRTEPRIAILHNLASAREVKHLISAGVFKGMKRAVIQPYGSNELVESSVRTNTAAWLDLQQDDIVAAIEQRIAKYTNTHVLQGENLQILHYADSSQQFTEHQDFFDPEIDPPESFEPGGNRMITVVLYLRSPPKGGETLFTKLNQSLKPKTGDAVVFWNLKPDGAIDKQTMHAGMPPLEGGEKWVATKWIHEKVYQVESAQNWEDKST